MDKDLPDSIDDNDNSDKDDDNDGVGIDEDNNDADEAGEYVNTSRLSRLPALKSNLGILAGNQEGKAWVVCFGVVKHFTCLQ